MLGVLVAEGIGVGAKVPIRSRQQRQTETMPPLFVLAWVWYRPHTPPNGVFDGVPPGKLFIVFGWELL